MKEEVVEAPVSEQTKGEYIEQLKREELLKWMRSQGKKVRRKIMPGQHNATPSRKSFKKKRKIQKQSRKKNR